MAIENEADQHQKQLPVDEVPTVARQAIGDDPSGCERSSDTPGGTSPGLSMSERTLIHLLCSDNQFKSDANQGTPVR